MKRLDGKVALVTGASRGIGRETAICLAEEGADVLVNDLSHPAEVDEAVQAIKQLGRRALGWQADVAERGQVEAMVKGAIDYFGSINIVVANAAHSVRQPVIEARWEDVQRTVAVTQFGVFHVCQFAAQQMSQQGLGGKIVIISSLHAEVPFANSAAYNMAKAAINQLAGTMAAELACHHINVNVINPGWIDTPGEQESATEEELRQGARRIPWGRLGTARDIARCVVFLASDDADYITGTCLRVDGGYKVGMTLPAPPAK
jgi:glucose 1-dehydrogenase